jgi:hypothetical protein
MTIFFPDCSNNDWGSEDLTDAGQQKLLNFLSNLQGFAGVCHKMSQGGGGNAYVDPYGDIAQKWCTQNNFPFIGYHYVTNDAPSAQVQNWQSAGGASNVMLDFEDVDDNEDALLDIDLFWALTNSFNAAGVNVQLLYLPAWYWADVGSPDLSALAPSGIQLISSAYPNGYTSGSAVDLYASAGGDTGEGFDPYGGCTPAAWQFTSSCNVAFIQPIDCNAYPGADINSLFG